jgi:hypothetical protein
MLGAAEVFEAVGAQVAQRNVARKVIGDQLDGRA